MAVGIFWAVVTCLLWGWTFAATMLIPGYSGILVGLARELVIGTLAIGYYLWTRGKTFQFDASDKRTALVLGAAGQIVQPIFFFLSTVYAGSLIAGVCYGFCPVLVSVISNWLQKRRGNPSMPVKRLVFPISMVALGFIFCNFTEFKSVSELTGSASDLALGVCFGLTSTALFTYYSIKNAEWMLAHKNADSVAWFSIQCIVMFPVAIVLYAAASLYLQGSLLGAMPERFVLVMVCVGLFGSFLPGITYNMAASRIPTSLLGQLLVLETLFGVTTGQIVAWEVPGPLTLAGLACFLLGVVVSVRTFSNFEKELEGAVPQAA